MKVTGPLFSLDASGSLGGAIVASKWKGRNYMRRLVFPANPKTAPQNANRAMWAFLSQYWQQISDPNQASWDGLAAAGNYAPFNAYMQQSMARWQQYEGPSTAYPALEADLAATIGALTLTGGIRQITGSQILTTLNQNFGLGIALKLGGTFTATKNDTVKVVEADTAGPIEFTLSNIVPGTYWVRNFGLSVQGNRGAAGAGASVVVTG